MVVTTNVTRTRKGSHGWDGTMTGKTITVKYRAWFVASANERVRTTMPRDFSVQLDEQAAHCAELLAQKMQWSGRWHGGKIRAKLWVFVREEPRASFEVCVQHNNPAPV